MMENAEEILQCLDEFTKVKPRDIPRELEEYLCFVAKTGDPVYQWSLIKSLFREKLINVITEFYESSLSVEIPPCPNVETFNYDVMKNFILEKLESFVAAPFTVQRICELLTTPRKEYNRIDKYMRALEKNILVVSTREPGQRRSTENGDSILNGLETDTTNNTLGHDVHLDVDMDETPIWSPKSELHGSPTYEATKMEMKEYKNESNDTSKEMKPISDDIHLARTRPNPDIFESEITHPIRVNFEKEIVPQNPDIFESEIAPQNPDIFESEITHPIRVIFESEIAPQSPGIFESEIGCNSSNVDIPPSEGDTTNKIFVESTPPASEEVMPENTFITNTSIIPAATFSNQEEKTEEKIEVTSKKIEPTESSLSHENNYPVCETVLDKQIDNEEDITPTTIEVTPSIAAVLTTAPDSINKIEESEVQENTDDNDIEFQSQDPIDETPKIEIENEIKSIESHSEVEEKSIVNDESKENVENESTLEKVDDNRLENNYIAKETSQEEIPEEKPDIIVKEVSEQPPVEEMEGVEEESAPSCVEKISEDEIQKTEEITELSSNVVTELSSNVVPTEEISEQITTENVENTEEKPSSPPHVEESSLEEKNVDDKSENPENSQ